MYLQDVGEHDSTNSLYLFSVNFHVVLGKIVEGRNATQDV